MLETNKIMSLEIYRSAALQAKLRDGGSPWPCHRKDDSAGFQVHLEGVQTLRIPRKTA